MNAEVGLWMWAEKNAAKEQVAIASWNTLKGRQKIWEIRLTSGLVDT